MIEFLLVILLLVLFVRGQNRVRALERRVAALEQRPAAPLPSAEAAPAAMDAAEPSAAPAETMEAAPEPPAGEAPAQAPQPAQAATPAPARGFEERFGTRWVVWVGGIALALGGIFLVQVSIEQGLIGPGVRLMLGGLLAGLLVAGGEWMRRKENASGFAGLPSAHIPSILTAAGTVTAFASAYASHGLYGFVGGPVAFILLGLIALVTLAAALLHGPALAGLGLVGAFVTPALVSSPEPNWWALTLYLAVVTAAAFALALARHWRWLAITAVVFGVLWILPGIDERTVDAMLAHGLHAAIGLGLAAIFIVSGFFLGPPIERGRVEIISSASIAGYVLASALLVVAQQHDGFPFAVFFLLVAATVAIAWRSEAASGAVPAAAVLAALVMAHWALAPWPDSAIVPGGPGDPAVIDHTLAANRLHIVVGAAFALLFAVAGYLAQGRSERPLPPLLFAAAGAFAPVAILAALHYRITQFDRSLFFAALALLVAAAFGTVTERLGRQAPRPGMAGSASLFATGAVAALALALTFALDGGWLSVGFALMAPGIAWVADKRPLPMLRWLVGAIAILVAGRMAWEPRIVGDALGTTPFFNWLLYGYGVPALAFAVAGFIMRRRGDDVPKRIADGAAILFTVAFASLEIRHYVHGGDIYASGSSLAEVGLQVSVLLAMAFGLERIRLKGGNIVHNVAALILAGLAFAGILIGLGLAENPWINRIDVGGPGINLLTAGYLIPALLAGALAHVARATRPRWYGWIAAGTAIVLMLLHLSMEVTRFFHGPVISFRGVSDAEQYAYSAVWLAFGVVLVLIGIALRSQPLRLASAAVIALTVAKVFLIDLGDLTGVYRALSFIGLGLVLVGIGWLYQRLLFPPRNSPAS